MKGLCPLASRSKGNCIYLGTQQTKILIDAGISGKATREKLQELNVDLSEIQAILITHEHIDHIAGLKVLALKLGIPVFCNSETAKGIYEVFRECPTFKIFATGETFEFGDLAIHPFTVQHDSADPVAFTIRTDQLKLGFCTDLGFATTLVQNELRNCDYLYLEANHQPSMVHASPRPMIYKQRVLSRSGHLSNEACGLLLNEVYHTGLKHVHLAHLSSECNSHQTALEIVGNLLKSKQQNVEISIAPQETLGRVIHF